MSNTSLDEIDRAFTALERGHRNLASTKSMNAGFASLRGAIDRAKAKRAAWLKVPFGAEPLSAREERALYMAPELLRAEPAASEPPVSPLVKCPRCLRPDADRGDVEAKGVCLDCHLAAPKVPAVPNVTTSEALSAAPPALDGGPVVGGVRGAGAVPSPYLPEGE